MPHPAMIDFHNHHIPARFKVTAGDTAPPNQRARWEVLARKLSDEDLLLNDIRAGRIGARVVNIPAQLIADADGRLPHDTIMAANDHVAELTARHPERIHGLASVDAYDGDRSASEAERAIRDLGLRGLFVDCARGELMIDAPQARPTLQIAATLGVPVFVHPVAAQPLTRQMARYGQIGTLFARGTANSASLIALVEGEVFSQLAWPARCRHRAGIRRTCHRRAAFRSKVRCPVARSTSCANTSSSTRCGRSPPCSARRSTFWAPAT